MTAPRAAARKQLATLLEAALVGTGKPAQTVYPYQVGDFKGATPVVAVTSGPMRRRLDSMGDCWRKSFQLLVYVFVAYSDSAGWTEDMAEDAIDASISSMDLRNEIAAASGGTGTLNFRRRWMEISFRVDPTTYFLMYALYRSDRNR